MTFCASYSRQVTGLEPQQPPLVVLNVLAVGELGIKEWILLVVPII